MDIPQSINKIIDLKNTLKESISTVDTKQFDGQTFGNEGEYTYTYKDLLSNINDLLKNVTILTKSPKQFLKISTYSERNNIRDYLKNINNSFQNPNDLFTYLERLKQAIRHFQPYYTKKRLLDLEATLDKYDKKLDEQNIKYKEYDVKIKEYETEKDKSIENLKDEQKQLLEQVEELIKQAKYSLGLNASSGIGQFFQERLKAVEKVKSVWWIIGAFIFILLGIFLTYYFITLNPKSDISTTLSRMPIVFLPLAAAWFCAGQYTKLKNIAEDYAYKTVLAQSIIGFSEQLKNDDTTDKSYQNYMKKMLDEIHQHPVPKHVKEKKNIPSIQKTIKKVTDER